ncbi:DUF2283 domain-containing protein [Oceanithermus sp.]
MKFEVDEVADAVYFRLKQGRVVETREVEQGVLVDYDDSGDPIGVEVLNASQRAGSHETNSLEKLINACLPLYPDNPERAATPP